MSRWKFILLLIAQSLMLIGGVISAYAALLAPNNPKAPTWEVEALVFIGGAFICSLALFLDYDKLLK
jgi:hypothetical protein